jgi:hypothetical protein
MIKIKILIVFALFSTILYAQVDTLWSNSFNGTANSLDGARAVLLDDLGNVYSAGNTAGNGMDICIIKYSSNGDSLWSYIFASANFADDYFLSMVQSDSGFIYLACCAITIQRAFFIIKLSPDGNLIWTKQINDMIGESNNKPTKRLQVDDSGNVYFTGTKEFNFYTIKLNPAGDTLWTKSYGNSGYTYDDPSALTIDANKNVYVTGKVSINGSYDFCTIKYNTLGEQQWAKTYDGSAHNTDYPYAVSTDLTGNIYVAGSCFIDGSSNTDFCLIKYNADGDSQWVKTFDGSYSLGDEAFLICIDENNNLFVGGNRYGGNPLSGGSGTDFCLLRYNLSGDLEKSFIFNGTGNDEDYLNDFTIDNFGNLFLVGESYSNNTTYRDICVAKFDSTANFKWQTTYSGTSGIDRGYAVAVNDFDEVVVVGEANYDFFTIKYKQVVTDVENNPSSILSDFKLFQNYPNPFNPSTKISWQSPVGSWQTLKVYDLLGREVATLVDEYKPAGIYEVEFQSTVSNHQLASGIYYYQLRSGNFIQTKKMVLLR